MTAEARSRTVAIGLGCERNADEAEIWTLVETALAEAKVAAADVACIASIASDRKSVV